MDFYLFFPASERAVILVARTTIVRGEENHGVVVETLRLQALHDVPHGGVEGRDGGRPVPLSHVHGGVVLRGELRGRSIERVVRRLEGNHQEQRFALVVILNDRLGAFRVHLSGEQPCSTTS